MFPRRSSVQRGLAELLEQGLLWRYIGDSLRRVGDRLPRRGRPRHSARDCSLGWYPAAAQVVNPVIQMLRPISPIAWIPVAIVLFGVGDLAAILSDLSRRLLSDRRLDDERRPQRARRCIRRAGRNFGLSPAALLARVVFPAALPQMLVGLRIALGIAWLVVVAAEMIAVDSGLGYLVIDARNAGKRYDLVVAAMILIGLIGLALDIGFRRAETLKSVRWGFRNES